jgi:N-methylhydantoinase A
VATTLGIGTLIFPPKAGVASAFGMLTANPGFEFARSLPSPLTDVPWHQVRQIVANLVKEGSKQLRETGVKSSDIRVELAADVRHRGQGDVLTVELGTQLDRRDPVGQVEKAFEGAYSALYGRRPGVESEVMTWRVRVLGPVPALDVRLRARRSDRALKGKRPVWFPTTGFIATDVYDRDELNPRARIEGPAVVEERESTMVIGPGASAVVDRFGNLVVALR